MRVKFIAISALGRQRQIGLNGGLPWNIPSETQHYKTIVKDQVVLIGRKNFEHNNGDIEGVKETLVLSKSNPNYFQAMDQVIQYAEDKGIETIFVIGGAEIYNLTLPYLSEFYCSVVDYDGPADAYFPEYMSYEWEMLDQKIHENWTLYHMRKRPDF